jgi:hypothetical protein
MTTTVTVRRAMHPATFRPSPYDDEFDAVIQRGPAAPPPLVFSGIAYVEDATANRQVSGRPPTIKPLVLGLFAASNAVYTVQDICTVLGLRRQSVVNILAAEQADTKSSIACIEDNTGKRLPNKYQRKGALPHD